MEIKVKNILYF